MAVSRGPLNYTTSVDASKTAGEIVAMLITHGASAVSQDAENGRITAIRFTVVTEFGPREYRLPVNVAGVLRAIKIATDKRLIRAGYANHEQAERTAWRVVKDWTEAQLALVEAEVVLLDQVMLPYMIADSKGSTVWDRYLQDSRQAALEA